MNDNIFRKALEVLDERGWYQGGYQGPDGSVCAEQALTLASDARSVFAALKRLRQLLPENLFVHEFNDDPLTTEEDVRLLLKRAAVELESEEGL